jgi:hypothetical protein
VLTCGLSTRDVVVWRDHLVSKRKNLGCHRHWGNVCCYPRFGKRIQKCLSLPMGLAVENKYSRPRAAGRFTWPKPYSSHCLQQGNKINATTLKAVVRQNSGRL